MARSKNMRVGSVKTAFAQTNILISHWSAHDTHDLCAAPICICHLVSSYVYGPRICASVELVWARAICHAADAAHTLLHSVA